MAVSTTTILETSIQRLFPNLSLDQALAELLLERAQKNLIKYQTTARRFEAKYEQDFDTFRQAILTSEPGFEMEQDYFDWELAITGSKDMEEEIERLKGAGATVMNVADLLLALPQEARRRVYINRLEMLDQTPTLLKARLYVSPTLFIQVYRNDRFDTTSLALIYNGQRLYGRDQLGPTWHRHPITAPDQHDTGVEGGRAVNVAGFLDEVETALAALGLP